MSAHTDNLLSLLLQISMMLTWFSSFVASTNQLLEAMLLLDKALRPWKTSVSCKMTKT